MLGCMKSMGFDTKVNNECHLAAHFSGINMNSSIWDAILLTNIIFLAFSH
jgi:hypothetical protein